MLTCPAWDRECLNLDLGGRSGFIAAIASIPPYENQIKVNSTAEGMKDSISLAVSKIPC